jgi:SAM-dependent methyltransferase
VRDDGGMTTPDWDAAYMSGLPAPWDIGRPQRAFARLAESGLLSGRVLDAGCGTGEHALLAAAHGADAAGIDISPQAIGRARRKAAERGLTARFEVADVLSLGPLGLTCDTVIADGWAVTSIAADTFEIHLGPDPGSAQAWLATIRRTAPAGPGRAGR